MHQHCREIQVPDEPVVNPATGRKVLPLPRRTSTQVSKGGSGQAGESQTTAKTSTPKGASAKPGAKTSTPKAVGAKTATPKAAAKAGAVKATPRRKVKAPEYVYIFMSTFLS